ncbi:Ig-like domain-containing protein [Candidatus Woesearchaeota archaeon]|nr:Ig-like domain-containing protein [Candidatus Woesearchaeota archaeon]
MGEAKEVVLEEPKTTSEENFVSEQTDINPLPKVSERMLNDPLTMDTHEHDKAPYNLYFNGYRLQRMSKNEFIIEATLETKIPLEGTINFYLPNTYAINEGEPEMSFNLEEGSARSFRVKITIPEEINPREVGVSVHVKNGFLLERRKILNPTMDILQALPYNKPSVLFDSSGRRYMVSLGVQLQQNPVPRTLEGMDSPEGAGLNQGDEGDFNYIVAGTFLYEDRLFDRYSFYENVPRPIRRADVTVFDKDTGEILALTSTDNDGQFEIGMYDTLVRNLSIVVFADTMQSPELLNPLVFDKVANATHAIGVDYLYHQPTENINFTDQPVLAEFSTNASRAFNILDVAKDVEDYLKAIGETEPAPQRLTYYWDIGRTDGKYYDVNGNVYLKGDIGSDDDSYDDTVILHETGHYLTHQYSQYEDFYGGHGFSGQWDIRLAYTEGIATYISAAVRAYKGLTQSEYYKDPAYYIESNGISNRTTWYGCFGDPACTYNDWRKGIGEQGAGQEVSVGAALYDIVDSTTTSDDSPGSDDDSLDYIFPEGDKNVWDSLKHIQDTFEIRSKHVTMESFWDGWAAIGYPHDDPLKFIFDLEGIKYFADVYESDDTFETAKQILPSEEQAHTFYAAGDYDLFQTVLNKDTQYVIYTHALYDGADTVIQIYDANYNLLDISDDATYKNTVYPNDLKASSVFITPLEDSTYFINVSRYHEEKLPLSGEYGYYTLGIERNPLHISEVSPQSGSNQGDTSVTLTGEGFTPDIEVWFGDYEAEEIVYNGQGSITAIAPNNIVGNVSITVKNQPGQSMTWTFILNNAFEYTGNPLAPVLEGPDPSHGPQGRPVVLRGSFFYDQPLVSIGDYRVTDVLLLSSRELSFTVPYLEQGLYDVKVINPDNQTAVLSNGFEISREYKRNPVVPLASYSKMNDTIEVSDELYISDLFVYLNFSYYSTGNMNISLTTPSGKVIPILEFIPIAENYDCGKGCTLDFIKGIDGWIGIDYYPFETFATYAGSRPFSMLAGENTQGVWTLTVQTFSGDNKGNNVLNSWGIEVLENSQRPSNPLVYTANEYRGIIVASDPFLKKPVYQINDCYGSIYYGCEGSYYPQEVTVSPDNNGLWFAPNFGKGISIFDPNTGERKGFIELFNGDWSYLDVIVPGILFSPDGSKAFVNRGYWTNQIDIFSATPPYERLGLIENSGTNIVPTNDKLYVINESGNRFAVYSTGSFVLLKTVETFDAPVSGTLSSDGSLLVIAHDNPHRLSFYTTADESLIDSFIPGVYGYPQGIILSKDGNKVYETIPQWYAGINIIDINAQEGYRSYPNNNYDITTYNKPGILPSGEIVIANWYGDQIYLIDPKTDKVIIEYEQGTDPGYYIRSLTTSPSSSMFGLDTTPPNVTSLFPLNNSESIDVESNITAMFSESILPQTVTNETVMLSYQNNSQNIVIPGSYVFENLSRKIILSPESHLLKNTTYRVTILDGITDISGNHLSTNYSSSFTTASSEDMPTVNVTYISPSNNSRDVWPYTTITIDFSTSIKEDTITTESFRVRYGNESNHIDVLGSYTFMNEEKTVIFDPYLTLLENMTYTVALSDTITDVYENKLIGGYNTSFTTAFKDSDNDLLPDYLDEDDDNDGILDSNDSLMGEVHHITTNIPNLEIQVNGSSDLRRNLTGPLDVVFREADRPLINLINFTYNFTPGIPLDLTQIKIEEREFSDNYTGLLIYGVNLTNGRKTFTLKNKTSIATGICIKDAEIVSLDFVSFGCNQSDERKVTCDGTNHAGYFCSYENTTDSFWVTGLGHSGVRQINYSCTSSWSCNSWSSCSGNTQTCNGWIDSNSCGRTYTGSNEQSCSSDGGGGGGGGGGSGSFSNADSYVWDIITSGKQYSLGIKDSDVTNLSFRSNKDLFNVEVGVQKVTTLPETLPEPSSLTYSYFKVNTKNLINKDISQGDISFRVNRTFVRSYDASRTRVMLLRFNEDNKRWEDVATVQKNSDETYAYYAAMTPGFSYFAITLRTEPLTLIANKTGLDLPLESDKSEVPQLDDLSQFTPSPENMSKGENETINVLRKERNLFSIFIPIIFFIMALCFIYYKYRKSKPTVLP